MIRKKTKILFLVVFCILSLTPFLLVNANGSGEGSPPELINEFLQWGLWAGAFVVAGVLIYGGILYLTSGGNVKRINSAREKIRYSFLGLLILLSSFLILNTINPQLVKFPLTERGSDSPEPVKEEPTEPGTSTTTFQEMPIGTLTEKLLAKDIDCYRKGEKYETMVDCQDNKEVEGLVNQKEARKGYCYNFDDEGMFRDANSNTEQIDPLTEHDRMDCITKFEEPVNMRMKKLEKWSQKIKELTQNGCNCKQCNVDGNCLTGTCAHTDCREGSCHPKTSCKGKPYEAGDPCKSVRNKIDKYRKRIRRNYTDKELKKMATKYFNEHAADTQEYGKETVLVADQVRFLMVNFLKPLEKDLENDLRYLRNSENFLKSECPYQSVISHANFYFLKEETQSNWSGKKFCEKGTSWNKGCSEKDKVEITKYCKDFNAKNCTTTDEGKLPCFQCDLDKLGKGDCATSTVGERKTKTCKPSEYLLNNETGESGCTTTNATCTLCKIEDENPGEESEKICKRYDDDPATFYCPNPNSKNVPKSLAASLGEVTTDPEPSHRYPRELVPIGNCADGTENYGQLILTELKNINERIKKATAALFNPNPGKVGKLKKPTGDLSVLYTLPLSCRCQENPDKYWGATHCLSDCECAGQAGCCDPYSCNCDDDGCDTCCSYYYCNPCNCYCPDSNPCLMDAIKNRYNTVKKSKKSIKKSFERIRDLVEVKNLKQDDPDRHELLTMLSQSREKMQRCLMGFEDVAKEKMNFQGVISCSLALDLIKLGDLKIEPNFPIPNYNNCYPPEFSLPGLPNVNNSCYPYSHKELSNQEKEACLINQDSDECQNAISNLGKNGGMNNFFCVEVKQP